MKIGQQYYNSSISPIDTKSPCQKSYIIVIGDGDWYNHSRAVAKATALKNKGVKTFAVAFGTGISSSGKRNFDRLAAAGGTTQAIVATTAESLKTQLKSAISQIIASKLSFSAPAITATLNSSGSLYQAQFDYAQNPIFPHLLNHQLRAILHYLIQHKELLFLKIVLARMLHKILYFSNKLPG